MSTPYDPYRPPSAPLDGPRPADASAGVSERVIAILVETRPWVKLLAVLFFVLLGLGVVVALVVMAVVPGGNKQGAVTLIPLALVTLSYLPAIIFLWRYGAGITRLQQGGGPAALEEALTSQKSFWKYLGVLAIILLCLYAVAIFIGVGVGRMMRH